MTDEERVFKCECCTHALHVERDTDDGAWNFAVWEWYGYGGYERSWRQRLRIAWRVLRRGRPYGDHVVLSKRDANKLGLFLLGAPEGAVFWTNNTSTTGGAYIGPIIKNGGAS